MSHTKCTTHCFRCGSDVLVERNNDGYMDTMHGIKNGCGALFFQTEGNFGSTIFDPISDETGTEFLEIVICDDCVIKNRNEVDHVKVKHRKTERIVTLFEN